MRRLLKWVLGTAAAVVLIVVTVIFVRAFDARRQPDLKPWHRPLRGDIHAADLPASATLADYRKREDAVFRELSDEVLPAVAPKDRTRVNRYAPASPVNPLTFARNWNRTFEIVPDGPIRGGVLLIHGLTDSPYSVKAEAEIYASAGFYALALRMPGHGTVPGALTDVGWQDWRAAARLGARHVRSRIGPGLPFHFAGYSNGGALAVQYALDCLEDASLPRPDRVVLFSPMIGVVRYTGVTAAFAKLVVAVGAIPYFAKSRWLDIQPEYNPFKYNSFPAFAGQQTAELTGVIQDAIAKEVSNGRIRGLPPILAFASLVDSTVQTWATVDLLFGRLPDNGSQLVLYDVNRSAVALGFLRNDFDARLAALRTDEARRYGLTLVTNARAGQPEAVARSFAPGSTEAVETPLGLSWPPQVFSLSHLAVPFRFDDPLFGIEPDMSVDFGLRLGTLAPRGERGVLTVPMDQWMRINCNPFFPYEEARLREWIAAPK